MTPVLPSWIRSFRLDGYRSIYEYLPDETRLYGTESLCGDWSGAVLILAKDFADASYVEGCLQKDASWRFSHDSGFKTNKTLGRYIAQIKLSEPPDSCGLLYGSALAGLLRDDTQRSGSLPNKAEALQYGAKVLDFVIHSMPNLQTIVCMGEEAWHCVSMVVEIQDSWAHCRDNHTLVVANGLGIAATYHPAARVGWNKMDATWEPVIQSCRRFAA